MNYSRAIQCIQKLYIKYPESHLLQALHALALLRTKHPEEALIMARAVSKDQPIDPAVLQTLLFTFRDLDQFHDVVSMYETAHTICPEYQEFADQFIYALLYAKDYQQMQRISARFSKLYPNDPKYFYFNLVAMFLQAVSQEDVQKKNLLFTLCKKMLCRALNENKVKHVEELLFFNDLLEIKSFGELDPHEEKKAVQDLLTILPNVVKNTSMLRQLQLQWTESKSDVISLVKEILKKNNSDWDAWKAWLRFAPPTATEWEDFVSTYIPSQITRVYFLAQLEYHKIKALPYPKECVLTFFKHWGSHPSFYHDLSSFFTNTPCPSWQALLQEFPVPTEIDSKTTLMQCVNVYKLFFRHDLLQGSTSATLLYNLYSQSLNLESTSLPTDPHYAEELLILAMYMYVNLDQPETLYLASILLEQALLQSPYSIRLKMTLIWLYQQLGGVSRGLALYKSLDIKNLQWHTLGYMFSDYLVDLGVRERALTFLTHCDSIYVTRDKEAKSMLSLALEHGSYSK
ncbi:N-alpha-acetyltransferase 25, NatB auxiliary subunit, partial [Coelomomyces lativittatus]